jgi:hypothetical protein
MFACVTDGDGKRKAKPESGVLLELEMKAWKKQRENEKYEHEKVNEVSFFQITQ